MRLFAAMLLVLSSACLAHPPNPATTQEIASLFSTLEHSHCEFNRNGSWYGPAKAADHLRHKYAYLLRKGLVTSAEGFITLAASTSSMSGRAYLVRCDGTPPVESGPWFRSELARLRRSAPAAQAR